MSTIFRYSSGLPMYLPRPGLLQRAGRVPRRLHPRDHRRRRGVRTGQGQLRPGARARCSTRTRSSRSSAFNFYYGQGNRIEETVRGFGYHNQDLSFIKNTRMRGRHEPPGPLRDLQPVELAHVHQPRRSGAGWRSTTTLRARTSADGTDRSPTRARCSSPCGSSSSANPRAAPLGVGSCAAAVDAGRSGPRRTCRPRWPAGSPKASRRWRPASSTRPKRRFAPSFATAVTAPSSATTSASCCSGAGGTPMPLVEFRAASRLDPSFGPSRLLAGASLLALGQPRAAAAELGAHRRLMPREPAVHLQRADACERIGDVLCLADEYRTLVELSPADPEYAYRLGKAYLRLSQWAHERIQAIDPEAARLSQALGREYLEQGRADLAEARLSRAIRPRRHACRRPPGPCAHLSG